MLTGPNILWHFVVYIYIFYLADAFIQNSLQYTILHLVKTWMANKLEQMWNTNLFYFLHNKCDELHLWLLCWTRVWNWEELTSYISEISSKKTCAELFWQTQHALIFCENEITFLRELYVSKYIFGAVEDWYFCVRTGRKD